MSWSPQENDAFFGEPQEDTREPGDHADDAATMCVWCEERVCGACKSHYDTMTCTHRVFVPTAEQWDSAIEARAAELHEGCQMPMEQARALAASEAAPDWYARGQDWGLADALTNGQSGDWVLDDIARAFAAGASAAERAGRCAETLPPEVAQARQTAEYWKAQHLAGNTRIGELHDEAERVRNVLHRMLEAPTTQISVTWKDAVRQALALWPNV